jgi:hypothetical protein
VKLEIHGIRERLLGWGGLKNGHYIRKFMGYGHWFFCVKGVTLLKTLE